MNMVSPFPLYCIQFQWCLKLVCSKCLQKAVAPHSSTLDWKIPWTEEPGRLQSMGLLESDTTERLHFHFSLSCIGEGNGSPLQCSCLENPRDRGAWGAAISGVAQSQTRLKWLSSSKCLVPVYAALLSECGNWDRSHLVNELFDLVV